MGDAVAGVHTDQGRVAVTLTEFLLARIAEDEAAARAASPSPWSYPGIESVAGGTLYDATRRIVDVVYEHPADHDGTIIRHLLEPEADANGAHIARHDPARVLAECEAKRRIIDEHTCHCPNPTCRDCGACPGDHHADPTPAPCATLRILALPYADHPDYDNAWRA